MKVPAESGFWFQTKYQYRSPECHRGPIGGGVKLTINKRIEPLWCVPSIWSSNERLTLWMKRRSAFASHQFFHNPSDCTLHVLENQWTWLVITTTSNSSFSIPRSTCEIFMALSFSRSNYATTRSLSILQLDTVLAVFRSAPCRDKCC